MAKKKQSSKPMTIVLCVIAIVFGFCAGLIVPLYVAQSYFTKGITTDELTVSEGEVFYSKSTQETVNHNIDTSDADLSIHFLELGNKYTGDCTYIKVGQNMDILIDCGSKTSSISTVSNYLKQYVTDNTLEYVIVTHAHQDHYAGFATSTKIDSIFDLFECQTIITFAQTNQKASSTMYNNFKRELNDEVNNGATWLTADKCYNETYGAQREYNLGNNTSLEILYNEFYFQTSSTENNYSVCCMIKNGNHKFLFTGDLEADGESSLVTQYQIDHPEDTDLHIDLYKAGHHGSKTSSTMGMLDLFNPQRCCVCCCAGSPEYTKTPQNQFPTQEFINNISKKTIYVYVTTLCVDYDKNEFTSFNGNIIVALKDDEVGVNCSNNNTLLKDSDWFKTVCQNGQRTCPLAWAT